MPQRQSDNRTSGSFLSSTALGRRLSRDASSSFFPSTSSSSSSSAISPPSPTSPLTLTAKQALAVTPMPYPKQAGRPGPLPLLNLSSIKKITGWTPAPNGKVSSGPLVPPTPLANPPTPLTRPSSDYVTAASKENAGHTGQNLPHPIMLPPAPPMPSPLQHSHYQQQQYLRNNCQVPPSPPLTPALGEPIKLKPAPPPALSSKPSFVADLNQAGRDNQLQGSSAHPCASDKFLRQNPLLPDFDAQYEILDELGSGGFGFVVRARRRVDGLIVAVKFIFKSRIPSHGWISTTKWDRHSRSSANPGNPVQERLIPYEAYVLRMIRHPCVVAFIDLLEDDRVFYLVMEHHGTPWNRPAEPHLFTSPPCAISAPVSASASCADGLLKTPNSSFSVDLSDSPTTSFNGSIPPTPGMQSSMVMMPSNSTPPQQQQQQASFGKLLPPPRPMLRKSSCDLFECIEQHSRFPEKQAKHIFAQIVDVVYSLDRMGICHRDIKDENIVVDQDLNVKLIDFGSAVMYDNRKPPPYHNRFYGTINFAASEILQGKPYRAPHAEVWSLGVLLSVLLTGETPFADPQHAINGHVARFKCAVSRGAVELMLGCLDTDPESRFTISEVRHHPWLRDDLLS